MSLHKTYSFDEAALRALVGYDAASPTKLVWLQDHGDSKKGEIAGNVVDGEPGTVTAYWPGCVDKDGASYAKKVSLQIKRVVYWLLYPQEDQNDKPVFQVYAHTKVDPLAVGMYFQGEQPMFSLRLKNRDSTLPKEYLEQYAAREADLAQQTQHAAVRYAVQQAAQQAAEVRAVERPVADEFNTEQITELNLQVADYKGAHDYVESVDEDVTSQPPINKWLSRWDCKPATRTEPYVKVEANLKGECVLLNIKHNIAQVYPNPTAARNRVDILAKSYSGDWSILPLT